MSELEVLREQINQIDKQIVSLLAERFEIVEQV
jgi:chorismate mutase